MKPTDNFICLIKKKPCHIGKIGIADFGPQFCKPAPVYHHTLRLCGCTRLEGFQGGFNKS